ncbi:hypothetical protein J132_03427 [Termitomyces sp. J132]|nr:hypothetical protein J132_03427 [Termitomyces sp. J132]
MTPTPTYTMLANEIFTYLDPQNTGFLIPEILLQFLDDMGYPPNDNYCRKAQYTLLTMRVDMKIQ